jgi:RNA polymerase sigma factor (sigma-70 family)
LNTQTKKLFTEIYNDLISYADKQYKRNVSSVDIVNDLYLYLEKNPNKADSNSLSAFCYSYIYNQCSYTYRDKNNRYSNAKHSSIEDLFYIKDIEEEVDEVTLTDDAKYKLNKLQDAKHNMCSRLYNVYTLYYEQNYKYEEIVEIIGISLGEVYNRIQEIEEFINSYVENRQQLRLI